jgi:hypothetical protein
VEEIVRRKGLKIKVYEAKKFSADEIDSSSKIKKRVIELESGNT